MRGSCGIMLSGGVAACIAGASLAQPLWPIRPVRIVAPIAPGGPIDALARQLAAGLQERHGMAVVVENLAGGSGVIGLDHVRRAPADGYTLVAVTSGFMTIAPILIARLPYDIERDFAPVAMLARSTNVMVAHPSLRVSSVKDLVTIARARPGAVAYASPGIGSGLHLTAELFAQQAGIELLHVPYKGAGPALTDVLAGHVPLMMGSLHTVLPFLRSGRLRAIGVADVARSPLAPEIATLAEQGTKAVVSTSWYGLLAPGATPPAVVSVIAREAQEVLGRAAFREVLERQGLELWALGPTAFRDLAREERSRWARIIRERDIRAD